MEVKQITCKDCGMVFEVDEKEADWYRVRGWELPIRCRSCRKARKERKAQEEQNG